MVSTCVFLLGQYLALDPQCDTVPSSESFLPQTCSHTSTPTYYLLVTTASTKARPCTPVEEEPGASADVFVSAVPLSSRLHRKRS